LKAISADQLLTIREDNGIIPNNGWARSKT
jgi:hypothetical protein